MQDFDSSLTMSRKSRYTIMVFSRSAVRFAFVAIDANLMQALDDNGTFQAPDTFMLGVVLCVSKLIFLLPFII